MMPRFINMSLTWSLSHQLIKGFQTEHSSHTSNNISFWQKQGMLLAVFQGSAKLYTWMIFMWWRPEQVWKGCSLQQLLCHAPGYKRMTSFTLRGTLSLEGRCKIIGEKRVSPVRLPKQEIHLNDLMPKRQLGEITLVPYLQVPAPEPMAAKDPPSTAETLTSVV